MIGSCSRKLFYIQTPFNRLVKILYQLFNGLALRGTAGDGGHFRSIATLFGIVNETPIFGMPGYPTSCLSNAYIFLSPGLRRLAGLPVAEPRTLKAKMGSRFVSSSGREQFLTVRVLDGIAHTVFKKSGAITSMAHADGYIVLPVNLDVIEEGEEVTVTLLS